MKNIGLIVVLAILGIGAYLYSQSSKPAANVEVAQDSPTPTMTKTQDSMEHMMKLQVPANANKYMVDTAESKISWEAGKKLVEWNHNGTVSVKSGEIYTAKDETKGDYVVGHIVVDMTTIKGLDEKANDQLVGHLKSPDFFDVANFPTANIEFEAMIDPAMTVPVDSGTPYKATGTMTVRGKSKPVEFTFLGQTQEDGTITYGSSDLTLNRADYGVAFGSETIGQAIGDKIIKDEVPLEIKIRAKKVEMTSSN